MRNGCLILLSTLGSIGLLACSAKRLPVGDDGAGGGQAGSGGGLAGAAGTGGASGSGGTSTGGGTGGSAGMTGSAGAAAQGGVDGAAGGNGLSLNPSSATFASTLVEAVSATQTFTVRNDGNATTTLAALSDSNAADFLIRSNGCGTTLQPGASCELMVAFAPKTRSGSRSASLTVGAPSGVGATASLSGTALPSLGLLAGGLGGPGNLDGTGAEARFYRPGSIASDGAGNLYVADAYNRTIRKVDVATWAVTTFAGAPDEIGSADGTGAAARFYEPRCLSSDGLGNLYVGDNETIRKVVIATAAVTTIAGAAGETGSADGTGAAARFYAPAYVARDAAGNLYVTDSGNGTIRKIAIATGAVTTFAGEPGRLDSTDGTGAAAHFFSPIGIVSDGLGNLYVADSGNRTIRKVVIATRVVTTLAGAAGPDNSVDGTGTDARFLGPYGIVSDGAGHLYVTDSRSIRKVVIASRAVTTFAGAPFQEEGMLDGTGMDARFKAMLNMATDGAGNLYVTDGGFGGSIRRVATATAAVTTPVAAAQQIGSADGTGAAARFYWPGGVASDGAGNLYVADTYNGSVRKVVIATGVVTTIGGAYAPYAIAADGAGNVYVSDSGRLIRKIVAATGAVTVLAGNPADSYHGYADGVGTAARFAGIGGMASDGAGNLFVADGGNSSIRKVVIATGAVTTFAGTAGQFGNVDGTGTAARFGSPSGIASDGAGNLFVADNNRSTIRKIVIATAAVTTIAGVAGETGVVDGTGAAARFYYPLSIASDGASNLYVTESGNNTVRKVAADGSIVSTIIGSTGRIGVFLGALPASLNHPVGVVVLPTGELAIVDNAENAILIGHM